MRDDGVLAALVSALHQPSPACIMDRLALELRLHGAEYIDVAMCSSDQSHSSIQ